MPTLVTSVMRVTKVAEIRSCTEPRRQITRADTARSKRRQTAWQQQMAQFRNSRRKNTSTRQGTSDMGIYG